MTNTAEEYKVGLFATFGLLLFIITIIMLGGDRTVLSRHAQLKLVLENVEGLNRGSIVQLSGLKVGNVDDIQFVENENQMILILRLEYKFLERIKEGSTGGMRTQGALGDKFIYITPGPTNAKPMADGATLLTEQSHDLFTTLARRGDEFQKLFDVLNEVHKFTAGLNTNGGSQAFMSNMNQSTEELKKALGQLNSILSEFKPEKGKDSKVTETFTHLASIMKKVDSGQGTIGGLVNDPSIHERLKDFLGVSERKKNMRNLIRDTIEKGAN